MHGKALGEITSLSEGQKFASGLQFILLSWAFKRYTPSRNFGPVLAQGASFPYISNVA